MADDIVQRIVLVGDKDVTEALQGIAEAGERAFRRLSEAFGSGIGGAERIGLVLGGAVASVGVLSAAMFEFTRRMEESVDATKNLADQLGMTTEEVTGLKAAFADSGIGNGEVENSFRRLATVVQNSWAQIRKESLDSTNKLRADALSVAQAEENLGAARRASADLARDQNDARIKSTNSVREAELRLREVQLSQARQRGIDTSAQDASVARARDRLQLEQARIALADAQLKKSREQEDQEAAARKTALAEEKAGLDLDQARKKQREDQQNDIKNITEAVRKTSEGDTEALKSVNASAENIVKGIIAASGDAGKAIGELHGDLSDLASPAPEASQILETLGKTLANLENPMLETAVAARFFGRTVSQDFINVLKDQDKIKEFQQRIKDLGLGINETDTAIAEKFKSSLNTLQNDMGLVGNKIASVFGPTFTDMMSAVDQKIISSKDAFIEFAKAIDDGPIKSFIDALSGLSDVAGTALELLGGAFNAVAQGLNRILGTDLSGVSLALLPIKTVLDSIAASAEVVADVLKFIRDMFTGNSTARMEALGKALSGQFDAIKTFLSGDFKKGVEDFKRANDDYFKTVKASDDVDAQIAVNKRRRQRELADSAKVVGEETTTAQKQALEKEDADHKASTDKRIANNERLKTSSKALTDQIKSNTAETNKAAQEGGKPVTLPDGTKVNPDGSITDRAGTKILPGPNGGGSVSGSLTNQIAEAVARQLGVSPEDVDVSGARPARGSRVAGSDQNVPILDAESLLSRQLQSKQDFDKRADEFLRDLKEDWDQQQRFNENIARQNGGLQKLRPGEVSSSYPPPVLGHYDPVTQQFIPNDPKNVGYGFMPKTNDFQFGGKKNPFPYQPGISGPLSFPEYNKALRDSLPDVRPGTQEYNQQQQTMADAVEQGIVQAQEQTHTRPFSVPPDSGSPTGIPTGGIPQPFPFSTPTEPASPPTFGSSIKDAFSKFFSSLLEGLNQLGTTKPGLSGRDETGGIGIRGDAGDAGNAATSLAEVDSSASGASGALDSLRTAATQLAGALSGAGGGSAVEVAGGGLIRGWGTETSDSIPAWVSINEFITKAQSTRFWGTDFMHAVNRMDVAGVAARMPKFSVGGLVGLMSPAMPRFRDGGMTSIGDGSRTMPNLGTLDFRTDVGRGRLVVEVGSAASLKRLSDSNRRSSTTKRTPGFVS